MTQYVLLNILTMALKWTHAEQERGDGRDFTSPLDSPQMGNPHPRPARGSPAE